jgi:hypothetical protein
LQRTAGAKVDANLQGVSGGGARYWATVGVVVAWSAELLFVPLSATVMMTVRVEVAVLLVAGWFPCFLMFEVYDSPYRWPKGSPCESGANE